MRLQRAFLLKGFTLFALTTLLSLFGLEWAPEPGLFSPVAPVAGLAVSALILEGISMWPWIFLGGILSRVVTYQGELSPLIVWLPIINVTAYISAAMYLRRRNIRGDLSTLTDVRRLIGAAALVGAIAALGPLVQFMFALQGTVTPRDILQAIADVFFGRFTGVMLVGAAILTHFAPRVTGLPVGPLWQRATALAATVIVTAVVFGPFHEGKPITWVLFPSLIFCALLGGVRLTAQALLVAGAGALWGTTYGFGPFAGIDAKFTMLQQFLAIFSMTGLILAAVSTERRDREAMRQRGEDLRFLSNAAVELLTSSAIPESVKTIAPALAARCNVDIVTYHAISQDPNAPPRVMAQYGLEEASGAAATRAEVDGCVLKALKGRFPLLPIERWESSESTIDTEQSIRTCFCAPITHNGSVLGVLCVASRTRAAIDRGEGQLVETVGYYIGTAVRRLAQEERLRESEGRFRELADAVPDIVWVSQADGTPEFYNRRWYEFVGETGSAEQRPVSLFDFCDPTQRGEIARRWSECLSSGERFEVEHQLKHQSGEYRWVLTRAVPVRDSTGAIRRWFGTSTDLHENKMLQAERDALLQSERSARMEVERASRIKDDFLATLSHELRNPLNVMLGWAHLLSHERVDVRKAAGIIEQSGRQQAQLIEDLLDMSRIVSGKLSVSRTVVDVSEVVMVTAESMQLAAREKGVILETRIEPKVELPQADVSRIAQIVSNLLTNAMKFTPRGGRITVTLLKDGEEAVLMVSDTGQGISPEFLPHLFDRFSQADPSTTRRHGGLGIGLAVAKHMVSIHGGTITATSPGLGQGATFTVRLPLTGRKDEVSLHPVTKPPHVGEVPSNGLIGTRIIVVEDDPATLEFLSRFLTERGVAVVGCERGQAALDQIRSESPDVVISDISMPDMDGYQLARKIREIDRGEGHLPLVAVTAFARAEDETKALQAGFDAHLSKPLDPARLERVIVDLLHGSAPKAA